jgi:hypothetical protein
MAKKQPAPAQMPEPPAVKTRKPKVAAAASTSEVLGKDGIVYQFPVTFGAMADKLYELNQARQVQQKIADKIEAEEKALKAHIIETMPKSDSGSAGKFARISLNHKEIPQVDDWAEFYKHVLKTKNFALMQKRLAEGMIKEIWDGGKSVPGVKPFTVVTVGLNKI